MAEFFLIVFGIFLISVFGADNLLEFLWRIAAITSKFIVYSIGAVVIFALIFRISIISAEIMDASNEFRRK